MSELDTRLVHAQRYVERGWPTFVLGYDKRPLANCADCAQRDFTHDREACTCLVCHGFYAATLDIDRIIKMCHLHPGLLAVRTGRASGVVVLDFEGHDKDKDGQTGVELLEHWEEWSGGWSLPDTLRCRTASGGLHLYYAYPGAGLRGRNRILPNVDLKSDGGYVAVPCGLDARKWIGSAGLVGLGDDHVQWLAQRRTRQGRGDAGGSGTTDYDFAKALVEGPPKGLRDEFWRDWSFKRRKANVAKEDALIEARDIWNRQAEDADDPFSFEWVEYKVDRDWRQLAPDDHIGEARRRLDLWLSRSQVQVENEESHVQVGGRTFVARPRRQAW